MGVDPIGWNILGTQFRCREAPRDVEGDLALLLEGFRNGNRPVRHVVEFAVVRHGETAQLMLSPRGRVAPTSIPLKAPFAAWAEYHLICQALALSPDRWALHAAAVVAPGGTCIILGTKDAGKTTLALHLWAHGMPVLADDVLPIPYASRSPDPFARAFHTDRELVAPLRKRIPPRPPGYPAWSYPFPGSTTLEVPPVAYVLALKRGGPEEGEVTPLSRSETVQHLIGASIRTHSFGFTRVVQSAISLSEGCSAYTIRASSPGGAVERAIECIGRR